MWFRPKTDLTVSPDEILLIQVGDQYGVVSPGAKVPEEFWLTARRFPRIPATFRLIKEGIVPDGYVLKVGRLLISEGTSVTNEEVFHGELKPNKYVEEHLGFESPRRLEEKKAKKKWFKPSKKKKSHKKTSGQTTVH
jgi:hypothetical protein